jgi:hypothetical protein
MIEKPSKDAKPILNENGQLIGWREMVAFKLKYQDNTEKFIKHWSKLCGLSEIEFERLCIKNSDDLFEDDDII